MKTVIIGAGFTGLAAAWRLSQAGHQVTILEAQPYPGGLAAGFKAEGWEWSLEHHYHHIFSSDKAMLGLVEDMGLAAMVMMKSTESTILYQGKQYQLDSPLSLLQLPILSIPSRLRMAASLAYLRFNPYWRQLETVTAQDWLRQTMGEEAWSKIWQPLFVGKFGKHADSINAAWFWARIHARTKQLGYFQGGFLGLTQRMVEVLRDRGVVVHLSTPVTSVSQTQTKKLTVNYTVKAQPKKLEADRVIVAAPSPILQKIVVGLPPTFLKSITNLRGLGAATLILELDKPFFKDKTYWLNINEKWPLLAVVEHTNLIDAAHYGGKHLVYIGNYLDPKSSRYQLEAEALLATYQPYLLQLSPDFNKHLQRYWLFKTPFAQPIPLLNQSKQVPPLKTPIPGLYWASMQHVYPWDRGTNFAVDLGLRVAQEIVDEAR